VGVASACSDCVYVSVFMHPRQAALALVVLFRHPVARPISGPLGFCWVVTAGVFVGMVQKVIRLALLETWKALSLRAWIPTVAFVASGIVRVTGTKSAIFAHSLCDYTPVSWGDRQRQTAQQLRRICVLAHPHTQPAAVAVHKWES